MHIPYITRSLGLLITTFSLTLIPPIFVALNYNEPAKAPFVLAAVVMLLIGLMLWLPLRKKKYTPSIKDSFLIVVLFWLTLCIIGAVPFFLLTNPYLSLADAIFESVSGLTATGATTMVGLDMMPRAILYYRQQLQFLGGMGIILLAIAILPALGVGGMQLFRAEVSGPAKDENKLTPRIGQTAKALWMIYVGLTIFCTIAYWAAGMELFDAIGYSFGTVSTGGYTTHDASIGYFQSPLIQLIAIVFMFLGAASFSLHFIATRNVTLAHYWKNAEFKFFLTMIILGTMFITPVIYSYGVFPEITKCIIESLFHVVSLLTTTGFNSSNYSQWPLFIPIFLLFMGLIGGCSGSTSGGIKVVRFYLLLKQGLREVNRLIHPKACYLIKLGNQPLEDRVVSAVWGFFAVYIAIYGTFLLLLLATGLDFMTAYSSIAATLSNIGPGLAGVAKNYKYINEPAKYILSLSMFIGRLEIFTVLVLLNPAYWRT